MTFDDFMKWVSLKGLPMLVAAVIAIIVCVILMTFLLPPVDLPSQAYCDKLTFAQPHSTNVSLTADTHYCEWNKTSSKFIFNRTRWLDEGVIT
jgi:hypothetical protein